MNRPFIPLTRHAAWTALAIGLMTVVGCGSAPHSFRPAKASRADSKEAQAIKESPAKTTTVFTPTATNTLAPELLKPPTQPYVLGPGDKLELELLGVAGTRTTTFVGPDGKIYFDLLPGIDVWGLTLSGLRDHLESALSKYYARPHLSVTLTTPESQRIWILGRINKAGVFPLTGPTTLLEAISRAGGPSTSGSGGATEELADLSRSFIARKGEMLPVNFRSLLRGGDSSQNPYLEPDDFIYFPSSISSQVHVLGAVNGPRPIGFHNNMTVTTAIAAAMGTTPAAYLSHVAIIRGSLDQPQIAIVDLKAVLSGQAPDLRLEPHDIVYVPNSPYRTLERYAKLITDTFVRTVAANEGGHVVDSSFGGVSVSHPLSQ